MSSKNKMGYNEPPVKRKYNNQTVYGEYDGKTIKFRSKLEKIMADYLQLLKDAKEIDQWHYELMRFNFPSDDDPVMSWLMDFTVKENDGRFYHIETKGLMSGHNKKQLRLLNTYYPKARVWYVFRDNRGVKKMSKKLRGMCERVVAIKDLTKGLM